MIRHCKNDNLCYAAPNLIKLLTEIIWKTNYIPCKFINQEIKIKNECLCVYWLFNASFDKVLKERDWISKGLAGLQPGIKGKSKSESQKVRDL